MPEGDRAITVSTGEGDRIPTEARPNRWDHSKSPYLGHRPPTARAASSRATSSTGRPEVSTAGNCSRRYWRASARAPSTSSSGRPVSRRRRSSSSQSRRTHRVSGQPVSSSGVHTPQKHRGDRAQHLDDRSDELAIGVPKVLRACHVAPCKRPRGGHEVVPVDDDMARKRRTKLPRHRGLPRPRRSEDDRQHRQDRATPSSSGKCAA